MRKKNRPQIQIQRHYRQYDESGLLDAYRMVRENGWSVNYAAKRYGVPLTTLRDRVDGRIQLNTKQGAPTFFTLKEEEELYKHVKLLGEMGYGYGRKELGILAGDMAFYLKRKQNPAEMSKNWVTGFLKRWEDLDLKTPRSLAMQRAKCLNPETVSKYYEELNNILNKYNLHDKPECIYNIDETGISPEHKPHRVVGTKGTTTQVITSSRSTTATVIAAGNALGTSIPPFLVFKGVMLLPSLLEGALPGTSAAMSPSGWSNSVIFQQYLEHHFIKYCQRGSDPDQPILILYDGHASHVCTSVIEWARSKGIILFLLPPHTSHVLQPLDIACFAPFKGKYYKECQLYMKQNPGFQILRQDMCRIACQAYTKGLSVENLVSAFKKSGICPFNASVVPQHKFAPSKAVNPPLTIAETPDVEEFLKEKEPQPQPKQIPENNDAGKKRKRYLNLGGKAITEDLCYELIKERDNEKKNGKAKDPATKEKNVKNSEKKKSNNEKKMKPNKAAEVPMALSPQPGPSAINIVDSSCDSDDDDVDDPNDLCCICKKNSPPAMRNLNYIYFVNWGKCDKCGHWTHLKFCTSIRVLRRGDSFFCPHCEVSA